MEQENVTWTDHISLILDIFEHINSVYATRLNSVQGQALEDNCLCC